MAAPIVATAARALLKPKVFIRFLGTKAGKRATLKYGTMLLKSQIARNLIGKFINRDGKTLQNNKEYKKQIREYEKLQKKVQQLENKLDSVRDDNEKTEALTFTLGRQVVEMNRLLAQMQELYRQQTQQMQIAMANQKTR